MHRRQVDEQCFTGASSHVIPLQRSGFIGPLTLQDMILSLKWKKEESSISIFSFAGPPPDPVRSVDSNT